jgi:hypothetical protein
MLRHALESGFDVAIYTTLYGIDNNDADFLIDLLIEHRSRIEVVCIHLPDANGNMRGWKPSPEWEAVFEKFLALRDRRILSEFKIMTMDGSGQIHPALSRFGIKCGQWLGHSRAGSLPETQIKKQEIYRAPPRHASAVSCAATPFYDHNVLLPNGDVALCCMDYNLKHVIGNLLTKEYYELFVGEALNKVRQANMAPGFSDCSICKACDTAVAYRIAADSAWNPVGASSATLQPTNPRPWLKPVAELSLTLGRAFNMQSLTSFGDRLWRA